MKKSFKILSLLFLSAISLTSCSSDDAGESNGTTTGNYFPMAVNNKWQYTNDDSESSEINLTGTENFGANTYYKMTDTAADPSVDMQVYMNKRGASYYQKTSESTQTQGSLFITIEGFEVKMLQDDLEVGDTWSGSSNPKVTYTGSSSGQTRANIHYEGKITAKNATVTLGGITYTNVIKSLLTLTETVNSQTVTISGENWFSKDIGLIYDSTTMSTNNITETRYLTSYELH